MTKVAERKVSKLLKVNKLLKEREKTHGPAEKTFGLAVELINCMFPTFDWNDSGTRAIRSKHHFALIEIQHKISRILNGSYHEDHWNDIEGYARLGRKLHEKEHNTKGKHP